MPDVVAIGETMLRLSAPRGESLERAPRLDVYPAGSESNVTIALARLGTTAGWISRLVDNPLGRRIALEVRAHGVDISRVLWTADGRVGTYFLEPGIPPREHRLIYDRAASAMALIDPDEVDWAYVRAAKLVHLTGITPALSAGCRRLVARAVDEARRGGAIVCFDVNYRAKLWGVDEARQILVPLLRRTDIVISTSADAQVVGAPDGPAEHVATGLAVLLGVKLAVVTDGVRCAAAHNGKITPQDGFPVDSVDRIGAGDAFAAGFIHGYLTEGLQRGLEFAVAAAALKHTYRGDAAWISREDVLHLLAGSQRWR